MFIVPFFLLHNINFIMKHNHFFQQVYYLIYLHLMGFSVKYTNYG